MPPRTLHLDLLPRLTMLALLRPALPASAAAATLFVAGACSAPGHPPQPEPHGTAPSQIDPEALRGEFEALGWRPETIDLPPDFAPELPIGQELLLFAPGMFDAEAEDFWSYVFLMEINETGVDAAGLTEMFERYYDGLIGMVGGSRGLSLPPDPAHVTVTADSTRGGRYLGTIETHDAFVTGEPLSLRLVIDVAPPKDGITPMWIQASPHPEGHPIWSTLESACGALEI